jgi:hypothetical protein
VTSPLITSDFPIVAWSEAVLAVLIGFGVVLLYSDDAGAGVAG